MLHRLLYPELVSTLRIVKRSSHLQSVLYSNKQMFDSQMLKTNEDKCSKLYMKLLRILWAYMTYCQNIQGVLIQILIVENRNQATLLTSNMSFSLFIIFEYQISL